MAKWTLESQHVFIFVQDVCSLTWSKWLTRLSVTSDTDGPFHIKQKTSAHSEGFTANCLWSFSCKQNKATVILIEVIIKIHWSTLLMLEFKGQEATTLTHTQKCHFYGFAARHRVVLKRQAWFSQISNTPTMNCLPLTIIKMSMSHFIWLFYEIGKHISIYCYDWNQMFLHIERKNSTKSVVYVL